MAEAQASRQVVIVGGGLAGCMAALALAGRLAGPVPRRSSRPGMAPPYEITLIEAKSRLGGRVGSYTDAASGLTVDYCQHVGMGCCTTLKQLIQCLDQSALWKVERDLYFYGPGPQRQRLTALPWLPAPLHLSSWLWNWPGLNWRDRWQIARGMLAINQVPLDRPERSAKWEHTSASQWLLEHGQSPRVLERFWSTIIVSALGEQLDRVGLLPMAKVFQDGFLRKREAYHLLVPQRPLDDLLGKQIHAALTAAGVRVLTGTTAKEIHWQAARAQSITLSNGEEIRPDHVIVALPWHVLATVLGNCPDEEVQTIVAQAGQLRASPISGVHTWWDRAWLPTPHAVLVGQLCQWIFPKAELADSKSAGSADGASGEHYYQVVISASRMLPRGDGASVGRMIEEDLRAVFPEARDAKLLRTRVVTDPQAVFSVAPGTTTLRPAAGSCTGNLYWAGDWTNTGWPATMEGALRSGRAAAEAIQNSSGPR